MLGGAPLKPYTLVDSIDLSSRRKRREAAKLAIHLIENIHLAESNYLNRIPINLQGSPAYEAADETLDYLVDAIDILECAYSEPVSS